MPGKMARSAAHPPFRTVHVAAAVRATRLPCQNAGKAQKFALVRRFIWGIPVKCAFAQGERAYRRVGHYCSAAAPVFSRVTLFFIYTKICMANEPVRSPAYSVREVPLLQICNSRAAGQRT